MSRRKSHLERINQSLVRTKRESVTTDFTNIEGNLQNVPLDQVAIRGDQPRRQFDEAAMENLTRSIAAQGVVQSVAVEQQTDGTFELIAGERRVRAARSAGLTTIPARVFQGLPKEQKVLIAAMENLQRENLNPVDEVDAILSILAVELKTPREKLPAYLSYLRRVGHNVMSNEKQISDADVDALQKVTSLFSQLSAGTWESFVANKLGVLRLPQDLLNAVRRGELEYTKATALRKVKDEEARAKLLPTAGEVSLKELRHKISGLLETEPDQASELTARLHRVARLEAWRALGSKQREQAAELLQQLEELLASTK